MSSNQLMHILDRKGSVGDGNRETIEEGLEWIEEPLWIEVAINEDSLLLNIFLCAYVIWYVWTVKFQKLGFWEVAGKGLTSSVRVSGLSALDCVANAKQWRDFIQYFESLVHIVGRCSAQHPNDVIRMPKNPNKYLFIRPWWDEFGEGINRVLMCLEFKTYNSIEFK